MRDDQRQMNMAIERQQQQAQFQSQVQLYDYIIAKQNFEIDRQTSKGEAACLTHIVLKTIVVVIIYTKSILTTVLDEYFYSQIMLFFIVLDFWLTKNYNGRKLAGLHWSFNLDVHGKERFIYEHRINDQFIGRTNVRLFWMVQVVYIAFSSIYFFVQGLEYDLEHSRIFQYGVIIFAIILATVNFVLFYKASSYASRKKLLLKQKLPRDFLIKFGTNSLISYL